MTNRYQISETLMINCCHQIVHKKLFIFTNWAQAKPKFDFKITYQVNTNFPVGAGHNMAQSGPVRQHSGKIP
jgi:hypothetical protein